MKITIAGKSLSISGEMLVEIKSCLEALDAIPFNDVSKHIVLDDFNLSTMSLISDIARQVTALGAKIRPQ